MPRRPRRQRRPRRGTRRNVPDSGADFQRALDVALDLLEEEIVPLVAVPGVAGSRGVKRLLLRRFPYAVIVGERADEVFVIAFAHTARRPGYWRDRVK
jgi:toxin ParE1/3/4